MELLFNYETMKHTLVFTAYLFLIMLDCWCISYLVCTFVKWAFKKIKGIFMKKKEEPKEDTTNE